MFGLTPYERRNNEVLFYDPFKELENLEKRFFGATVPMNFKTDIRDTENAFVLEAELPGFTKEDIDIDVKDGYLTITAEHKESKDEKAKDGSYLRRERSFGSFTRSFDISEVEEDNISAEFKNGILEVNLPKKEVKTITPKKIEIH